MLMFDFLNNLDDEQLYVLLSNEKPVVIALALEQIENNVTRIQSNTAGIEYKYFRNYLERAVGTLLKSVDGPN